MILKQWKIQIYIIDIGPEAGSTWWRDYLRKEMYEEINKK